MSGVCRVISVLGPGPLSSIANRSGLIFTDFEKSGGKPSTQLLCPQVRTKHHPGKLRAAKLAGHDPADGLVSADFLDEHDIIDAILGEGGVA